MKSIVGITAFGLTVAAVYLLNVATRTDDGKSILHVAEPLAIPVRVAWPVRDNIVRIVQAPGEIEPYTEVEIRSEVVGKIVEMPVEEGDRVRRGDLLCRLDDANFRAILASAEANVARIRAMIVQAEADLEKAQRDLNRQLQLSEQEATSEYELAEYRTVYIRARATVDVRHQELVEAEARLQSAREDLAKTVIRSPIDGIVSQSFAKLGEVVITGTMNNPGTRVMVVSDLSRMQVRCRVDEADAPLVEPGQTARIFLHNDTTAPVPGTVYRVATKGVKPQGRDVVTFETLVLVDADDARGKPGMTASVEIEVAQSVHALQIPVQAVVERQRKDLPAELVRRFEEERQIVVSTAAWAAEYRKVVFVIEDDVAAARLVQTGIADADSVEILHGISDDELVAVGPFRSLDQLTDGTKVKIEGELPERGDSQKPSDAPEQPESAPTRTAKEHGS